MVIEIDKYPLLTLTDVSKIFTSTSFLRLFREREGHDAMQTFILCPNTFDPEKMSVDLVEANGFAKGFAIFPKNGLNVIYLACILNSAVSWAVMTGGNMEKRSSILLKNLKNVLVRMLPIREQAGVAYLQYLLMEMKRQKNEGNTNPYIDYWASKYHEAMNAIALELVMPQVFDEYEIDVLGLWLQLIGTCSADTPVTDWEHLHEIIGKELLAPQNEVTGNLNKLRVVMREVIERKVQK
ncbi:MAG: hypothetical protein J6M30_04305 [Bacteroidales bacterium]|nr:hypothetical protein [Bacteroidales bacterium]